MASTTGPERMPEGAAADREPPPGEGTTLPPPAAGARPSLQIRPATNIRPPAGTSDVPTLTWPLVERRRPSGADPFALDRRRHEGPPPAIGRLASSVAPPLTPFRWAAIAVGLVVASQQSDVSTASLVIAAILLTAYAAYRTLAPIPYNDDRLTTAQIVLEFAFHAGVVMATGAWFSPYAFSLLPTVLLAGFSRGSAFALRVTTAAFVIISVQHAVKADSTSDALRDTAAWFAVLALVAITSGFARQVSRESARAQSIALDRLGRLAEANALLFSLHRVAQTLPASLDLDDVLDSSMSRLRDLIEFDSTTVLLYEDSDQTWVPVRRKGNRSQDALDTTDLPGPLRRAMDARGAVLELDLDHAEGGPGLAPGAACGLYSSLRARGALIGLIAVESSSPGRFTAKEVELLNGLVEPLGVAIDNARWFARLRSIGADEERSRIARDLHDQIGQSLAYLGFELDRAVRSADRGDDVKPVLEDLRTQVRGVVKDVRETLYDLRADVSEAQDVGQTLLLFCERVRERSGLDVSFERDETGRLPLLQEREMWRIGKEAVINVERHAQAQRLTITWTCDGRTATLVVVDDGVGYQRGAGREDSYGIVGMRERATTIGATLEIDSAPGQGTTVRVRLSPDRGGAT